jgi:hypothetical protein
LAQKGLCKWRSETLGNINNFFARRERILSSQNVYPLPIIQYRD